MLSATTLAVTFLSLTSFVSAGGFGTRPQNWGINGNGRIKAASNVASECAGEGDFLMSFNSKTICDSSQTRTTPSDGISCPLDGWGQHKTDGCCIPPEIIYPCDCGEGYSWNSNQYQCVPGKGHGCSSDQWWHERGGDCCDNSWGSNPPSGECPGGIYCPTGWFWHKHQHKCVPDGPRCPAPDCPDWDNNHQCCGGGSYPSAGTGHGNGGWKRALPTRQQEVFPQTNRDKMYCPSPLHACSVYTPLGGEWAYECVDFATELESCGGCSSMGEGDDCIAIEHAVSVGCEVGKCAVYSCKDGFKPSGATCIRA